MAQIYGYAGKILRVDLSLKSITHISTMDYADRFIGGMGVAAKIFWDEVLPEVGAFDPENRLMFMNGPLAGFTGLAGSRWIICGKSPSVMPGNFASSNLGGRFGAQLKFAGYDGIVISGKSDKPVYLFIEDGVAKIKDASALWGKGAVKTRRILKEELGDKAAVAACGPAGENMVAFANILADNDASGSSGFGSVMGSKNLKAVVVKGSGKVAAANPEKLKEHIKYFRGLWKGLRILQDKRSEVGKRKRDPCYGCIGEPCNRALRKLPDGTFHKSFCMPPVAFHMFASMHYGDMTDESVRDIPMIATKMQDDYGLDSHGVMNLMALIAMGAQAGIVNEEITGLPLMKFGNIEFTEALLKKISYREGFGDVMAQGIWKTADVLGKGATEMLANFPAVTVGRDGRVAPYCPRAFPAHALLYAIEPSLRIQQLHEMAYVHFRWLPYADEEYMKETFLSGLEDSHVSTEVFRKIAERFWGSELAVDFSTYEGKALAAKKIQDRSDVKESLIVCDCLWPAFTINSGDYVGDPTLENKIFSAVTGNEIDEDRLNIAGERIFNLRRAINIRERGVGRNDDTLPEYMFSVGLIEGTENHKCLAPGKDGEVISLKGSVIDKEKFEKMKDEYYQLRGWDVATGLPTKTKLEGLGLNDIAKGLEQKGLIGESMP